MGHSYRLPTIKTLFAQAAYCAYPDCKEPLVFEDLSRGVRSIAAQIAHIRSEKPDGPRYNPEYPRELLHTEENLLLFCGKHHSVVDRNDSVFTTEELLIWKEAQIAQVGGTPVTDADLAKLVQSLESTLSELYEALQVSISVDGVGGRVAGGGIIVMPLEGLMKVALPEDSDPTRLFCALTIESICNKTPNHAIGFDLTSTVSADFSVLRGRGWSPGSWRFRG